MKEYKKFFLLFTFIMFCCVMQNAAAGDDTTWIVPKSASDIIGTWEGITTIHTASNPDDAIPESSIELSILLVYTESTARNSAHFKTTVKLDLSKFMNDFMNIPEIKALGMSKDVIWDMMCVSFKHLEESTGNMVTIGRYFVSYTISDNVNDFLMDTDNGVIFLNSGRTRMKLVFHDDLSQGLSKIPINEIILIKK